MPLYQVSLSEAQILQALGDFLTEILPANCEIIRAQGNRVAEPANSNFVSMTPLMQERLKTNEAGYADVAYVGAINGTALQISQHLAGAVAVDQVLSGQGIAAGTSIVSGSGNAWTVSKPQTVASTVIQSGTAGLLQGTKVTVQLDVHGPDGADNAQIISTLFRDAFAVIFFAGTGFDVAPLYCGDPHQAPFVNAEQQYEDRWVIDAVMQANPVVTVAQQFADALHVDLVEVDAAYPP